MECDDRRCGCSAVSEQPPASGPGACWVSLFRVSKMDCPAEERLIRLALAGHDDVRGLQFDLPGRELRVGHDGSVEPIHAALAALGLGAVLVGTEAAAARQSLPAAADQSQEAATLRLLLAINALMFLVEMVLGIIAQSTGLIGDSLDMFADAAVYGVALYAVGRGAAMQLRAARLAGMLQLVLALGLLAEVARRLLHGSEPQSVLMMGVACLALLANVACLLLIARHRRAGVHMRASWIFSANDVLINAGVILAGALVAWTGSNLPDLLIGALIGVIVLAGARRILALRA